MTDLTIRVADEVFDDLHQRLGRTGRPVDRGNDDEAHGQVEEIAVLASFLLSDESPYMSPSLHAVDGGGTGR